MNTKATIDKVLSLSRISDVRALDIARLLLDNEALAQSVEDNLEEYPYDVLHDINGLLKGDKDFVPRVLVTEEQMLKQLLNKTSAEGIINLLKER